MEEYAFESEEAQAAQDFKTYNEFYNRLKEKQPEHAKAELIEYWGNVLGEIRETALIINRAEHMCKISRLWTLAADQFNNEFGLQEPGLKELCNKACAVQQEHKEGNTDWNHIYDLLGEVDMRATELLEKAVEKVEQNPLFGLPQVQHAMEAEDALREPPKQSPETIYFAMLKETVKEYPGILTEDADVVVVDKLKQNRRSSKEIAGCLMYSPTLENAPLKKKLAMAKDITENLLGETKTKEAAR